MEDDILLVDENNNPIGAGEKMDVHRRGVLHRAFSILVYNSKKEMLLQRRAAAKYHCPGQWSNACCSHPAPGDHLLLIIEASEPHAAQSDPLAAGEEGLDVAGVNAFEVGRPRGMIADGDGVDEVGVGPYAVEAVVAAEAGGGAANAAARKNR